MMGGEVHHHRVSDEFSEATPLLGDDRPRRPTHRPTLSVTSLPSIHVPKVHNGWTVVNLLCVIAFIASSATGFCDIPVMRIVEDVICRHYFGLKESADAPIDEQNCKVDAIQEKVAFIMALSSSLDAVVGFIAAFPWGLAADRIGRRPVFAISLSGMLINVLWGMVVLYFHTTLPVELIWLGSAGYFLGGGNAVLVGIILSMITDSTTEEERAVAFMRLHVASLAGNLISPAVSSLMMNKVGPWPPIWIAVALVIISGITFLFVPETLRHPHGQEDPQESEADEDQATGLKSRVSHVVARFKESLSILKSPSLILLLVTCLGSAPILYGTLQFMAQFISKRYNIKLAQSGYVQSSYGAVQVVQALIILPWLTRHIMKDTVPARFRAPDEHHRDLSLARWSFSILVVGVLILGLAPTLGDFIFGLVLMALGSGFNSLTRSLMSLYVDPEHRSRLFSLVGMVEVVGSVYAQPFLAGLFALALNLGGGWIGLPYYGLSILVAATGSLLYFVKVPKEIRDSSSTRGDGQHRG
ncbi:MFS general substrate transporter [Jackrogersella minutella]|nr:MFS general substrate transporter [Jackrogersella minutella]